jgi:putative FmdB family regulatory protein
VPLYEYECRSCKAQFEQLVFNNETQVVCRECGAANVVQLLSTFAVGGSSAKTPADPGPCGSCGAAQRGMCGMMN